MRNLGSPYTPKSRHGAAAEGVEPSYTFPLRKRGGPSGASSRRTFLFASGANISLPPPIDKTMSRMERSHPCQIVATTVRTLYFSTKLGAQVLSRLSQVERWEKLFVEMTQQVQKVLSGGRITLNEDARETLKIKTGDYVILKIQKGKLEVIPASVSPRERDHKK